MIYSELRKHLARRIIDLSYKNKEGHIGSSLSILDLLYGIYSNFGLSDQFVLSKGHASLGLYVILEHFNLLNESLDNFCQFDSHLGGHPYCYPESNIQCATGSLGHGFPFALGLAMAKKIQKYSGRVYCIIGDGEANEGTIWETALLASHRKINNLCCIMDHNRSGDRALNLGSLIKKFEAFDWDSIEINGHNILDISNALKRQSDKPFFILANTTKGYGVPSMHDNPEWHHKHPNDTEYLEIIRSIL